MATVYDDKPAASRLSDAERDPDLKGSVVAGFEDPDEGLSDEERAAIVRDLYPIRSSHPLLARSWPGASAIMRKRKM